MKICYDVEITVRQNGHLILQRIFKGYGYAQQAINQVEYYLRQEKLLMFGPCDVKAMFVKEIKMMELDLEDYEFYKIEGVIN